MNMKFKLLSKREGFIAEKIVDAAITVHKVLGPGKRLGFLINFDVPLIKNGINRIILSGYALYSTGRKMQLSDFAVYRTASLRLRSCLYPVSLKVFQRGNVFQ